MDRSVVKKFRGSVRWFHTNFRKDNLQGILFKLHVVGDNTALPADGILGRDNICNRTILNTKEKQLIFYDKDNQEVLKCPLIKSGIHNCEQ